MPLNFSGIFYGSAPLEGLPVGENLLVHRKHFSEEPGMTVGLCLAVLYEVVPEQDGPTYLEKLVLQ